MNKDIAGPAKRPGTIKKDGKTHYIRGPKKKKAKKRPGTGNHPTNR